MKSVRGNILKFKHYTMVEYGRSIPTKLCCISYAYTYWTVISGVGTCVFPVRPIVFREDDCQQNGNTQYTKYIALLKTKREIVHLRASFTCRTNICLRFDIDFSCFETFRIIVASVQINVLTYKHGDHYRTQ